MQHTDFDEILFSYDIACQWHKKLPIRMKEFPEAMRIDREKQQVRYAIPKKHFRVHGPNHSRFSLNFLRWVARTYGEGIEALWAHLNPIAAAGREMSPGMRHEVYDDHWGG